MSLDAVVDNLLQAAHEQARNPALWQDPSASMSALLTYELQRLHELIFKLHEWRTAVRERDREMEAIRAALHRAGSAEAALIYELGLVRSAFMAYAGHRAPCCGLPCNCGFEHEQNRVRSGLMKHGISV